MNMASPIGLSWVAGTCVVLSACISAPEHCHGCLERLADAGAIYTSDATLDSPVIATGGSGAAGNAGSAGNGGSSEGAGSGGSAGAAGSTLAGGGTGGGAGGTLAGGGMGGSDGTGTGTGGRGTAGNGTGGSATGGIGTGGGNGGGTGGIGGASGSAGGAAGDGVNLDLVLWYKFDESNGMSAVDSAMFGGMARNASLGTAGMGGTANFSTMSQVGSHALALAPPATAPNANGGYVTLPGLQNLAPGAITLAIWVNLAANTATQNWERIFDFGFNTTIGMYLTARAGDTPPYPVRFAITTTGHMVTQEQRLDGPSLLTPNVWHHIAVVLPGGMPYTGILYVDGAVAATKGAMTLHAADLGATIDNRLGRSQFAGNPYYNGLMDDFRVYKRALTGAEIMSLYAFR